MRALGTLLLLAMLAGCTKSSDLTAAEKALLVTEADFVAYGLEASATPQGAFTRTRDWINRANEYEYQSRDGADYYVYNIVTFERSSREAAVTNFSTKAGLKIGFMSSGVTEKPVAFEKPIGSQSLLTILMKDGKPIGNTFSAVVGKTSVLLIYSGIYFETEEEFREFIEEKVKLYRT
jgi:hypothetical protein